MNSEKLGSILLNIYVVSVVFEFYRPDFLVELTSISFISAIVYILFLLYNRKRLKTFIELRQASIFFLVYMFFELLSTLLNLGDNMDGIDSFIDVTVLFNIGLLYFMTMHLTSSKLLIKNAVFAFSLSIITMSIMYLLEMSAITFEEGGRLSFFGENPNSIGNKSLYGIVFSVFLLREKELSWIYKSVLIVGIILSFQLLLATASRGSFAAIILFGVVYFLITKANIWLKMVIGLMAIPFVPGYLFQTIKENEVLAQRFEKTVEQEGILDDRAFLYQGGIDVFLDGLVVFGTGRSEFLNEMKKKTGLRMDTHNAFITALAKSGLIGFTFFLLAIVRMLVNSIKLLISNKVYWLSAIMAILIIPIMNKSGGIIGNKFLWLIFSLIISYNWFYTKQAKAEVNKNS